VEGESGDLGGRRIINKTQKSLYKHETMQGLPTPDLPYDECTWEKKSEAQQRIKNYKEKLREREREREREKERLCC